MRESEAILAVIEAFVVAYNASDLSALNADPPRRRRTPAAVTSLLGDLAEAGRIVASSTNDGQCGLGLAVSFTLHGA